MEFKDSPEEGAEEEAGEPVEEDGVEPPAIAFEEEAPKEMLAEVP